MNKINLILLLLNLVLMPMSQAATFAQVGQKLGIDFTHTDGRIGEYQFTETAGSGLGFFDYDNDGNMDLLIVNGDKDAHKLFRNTGHGFTDVTQKVLPHGDPETQSKGMGVCSADINQDGWVDFLISNYGDDVLYLNNKGQGFSRKNLDKTPQPYQWSTSCAFADLDADGDLDLYISRYAKFKSGSNQACQSENAKGYCNPSAYSGATDGLYINDGQGNFSEVSLARGINKGTQDRGFGVVISDFDQDGDFDIYVANDGTQNRLYINDGKGFFSDNGLFSGAAINQDGMPEGSMGVAMADINHDGHQDLLVSHYAMETNTLYQNLGDGNFADMTHMFGIKQNSYMSLGWGVAFVDINNNGFDDLIVANGHIHDFIKQTDARQSYGQLNQVFINQLGKTFELQKDQESFSKPSEKSTRGLATADWNNDGKIDFAVNNIVDTFEIYQNTDANSNNWLGIKLIGNTINSSAIGAMVSLKHADLTQTKQVASGGSFMSQSDLRLIFGLAATEVKQAIEVHIKWPDGKQSTHTITAFNQYHSLYYPK